MAKIETALAERLAAEGIAARLVSRIKAPWSVYSKMHAEHKSFAQVMDVYGFRIVTDSVTRCYQALGAVHALYKPLDARFKDFIAIPKANGYQSLHTVLFGPFGAPIEIQIRTEDMDTDRRARHRRALGLQDRVAATQRRPGACARMDRRTG